MLSSLLLALALPVTAPLGPLLKKGEAAPAAVCSAFAVSSGGTTRLFTAAHCLGPDTTHLWLPGLVGNGLTPGKSRWDRVLAFPAPRWVPLPGRDLVWVAVETSVPAWPQGKPPVVGDVLTVMGYPQGQGPQRLECIYRGMLVLDGPVPQVRPSLECPRQPAGALQGLSGGVVLNAQQQAVGVLVSGARTPLGWAPGFEPLAEVKPGPHREVFWTTGTAVPAPAFIQWDLSGQGKVQRFRVLGPGNEVLSFWPPLPSAPATDSLRP